MKATLIVSALLAATVVSAGRLHTPTPSNSQQLVHRSYIVEYHENVSHNHFIGALKRRQIDVTVRKEYDIFNGAAITIRSDEHSGEHLASLTGVKNVWPVTTYSLPHIREPIEPFAKGVTHVTAASSHNATGVTILQNNFNLTGTGIKVGVLDSGVDYNHPVFAIPPATKGCFIKDSPNCRFIKGWDFVGDKYTGDTVPVPGPDPMDRHGHGTHVAGIIGGNALSPTIVPKPAVPWVGVAPGVTFGIYKVIGDAGVTTTEVLLSAMEMAFKDGMDIINMSLGGGSAYKDGPEAKLAETLTANGMVVISAAGNEGSDGVWMVSDLGLGDSTTSVASFDGDTASYTYFTYGGVNYPYQSSLVFSAQISPPAGIIPILSADGSISSGCNPALYSGLDLKGKLALVKYSPGECDSKARQASFQASGAIGFLVQAQAGNFVGFVATTNFPVAGVDYAAALALVAAWKANPASAFVWGGAQQIEFKNPDGAGPSSFSSYGLDGELRSKPDIGAPGGKILSAYPLSLGGYDILSGTSMATPYVVGANALYMQAKNSKPLGVNIRRAFKNTATFNRLGSGSVQIVDSALKQGSGLINVLNAVQTTTLISPDHIDLLDTVNFKKTVDISITNSGAAPETYTLSHVPADTLTFYVPGDPFPQGKPTVSKDQATVSFGSNQLQVAAGQSATVTLTFTEPTGGNVSQFPFYSGFVVATPATAGGIPVHVPYTGMKGDIRNVPMMDTLSGFPDIAMVTGNSQTLVNIPRNFVFDFMRPNASVVPVVLTRLGSHSPDLMVRVYTEQNLFAGYMSSPSKGPAFGPTGRQMNVDENTKAKEFAAFDWEGEIYFVENATSTAHQIVPSGTYKIVVAAQKKFTKGVYPTDFEVYNLGPISVKSNGPPLPELKGDPEPGTSSASTFLAEHLGLATIASVLMSLMVTVYL